MPEEVLEAVEADEDAVLEKYDRVPGVADYVNARWMYAGMLQGVSDGIDADVAAANAETEAWTHEDGTLHKVEMRLAGGGEGRAAYVTRGAVYYADTGETGGGRRRWCRRAR